LKTLIHSDLEQIMLQNEMKQMKSTIDAELAKLGSKIAWFGLSDQMTYALLSHGKRLRPIMTLLSTASVGGDRNEATKFALALELMHAATLVHDDVLDNDVTRRGICSVHKKWSVGEAILAGDAMLSLALSLIINYNGEVLKTFSETGMYLTEGEYMDLKSSRNLSEEDYLRIIERKSASLFRASTKCGALIGKGSPLEVTALASFGKNFGMAYQIRDDIMDLIASEGEEIPADLKQQRITLPIIHLYPALEESEEKELCRNIGILVDEKGRNKIACFQAVLQLLEVKGSIDYCKNKVNLFVDSAIRNIQPVKDTVFKRNLLEMVESLRFATTRSKNKHKVVCG
jgi:geranylgeranyl diphosphate synthase type I